MGIPTVVGDSRVNNFHGQLYTLQNRPVLVRYFVATLALRKVMVAARLNWLLLNHLIAASGEVTTSSTNHSLLWNLSNHTSRLDWTCLG